MALPSRTRLGPYEIVSSLGAGGMGEVYRARDTRLDRTVAIKIINSSLVATADLKRRLQHEARAISHLQHPHICTLYDIGSQDGTDFLVMEYLEGETLARRLRGGPVPLPDALNIAVNIAGALHTAHRQGIVHRDLKPGNIMLTSSGAKLMDFGLAKPAVAAVAAGVSEASTLSSAITAEHRLVGTLHYMSPEQIRCQQVDTRSDVFSFGSVLYEMISGKRPFQGGSDLSVASEILEKAPEPLSALQPTPPPVLQRVVERCLEKNPENRYQSARDLMLDLMWVIDSGIQADTNVQGRPRVWRNIVSWSLAALGLIAVTLLLLWSPHSRHNRSMRLAITLPEEKPLAPAALVSPAHDRPALALSPDGSRLAYVAVIGNLTQICVRDMQSGEVWALPDTVAGHTPFFSPDGGSIGFFADGKLKKIASSGGPTQVLVTDVSNPWGAVWGQDGSIYFNRNEGDGIYKVAASGGPVEVFNALPANMPEWVGSGRGLLVHGDIDISYLEPDKIKPLVRDGAFPRWIPPSHILYSTRDGKLAAVPFDPRRVEVTGPENFLFDGVRVANYGVAQFTTSHDGTLVYAPGRPQNMTSFVWVDRKGNVERLPLPAARYGAYALSPDGRRLAYTLNDQLWIYDIALRTSKRLTTRLATGTPPQTDFPRWGPDSRSIVYQLSESGASRLMWLSLDNSEAVELWANKPGSGPRWLYPMGFTSSGTVLSVFGPSEGTDFDLYTIHLDLSRGIPKADPPELFLQSRYGESFGQISPDGHWILYASERSGRTEAYVTTYPKPGRIFQVSQDGAREPMWNPTRPEIVFLIGTQMYGVDVKLGPGEFRQREPRLLFQGPYPDIDGFGYDMSPDGRFLMLENKDVLQPTTTLTVITNLYDHLHSR